MMNQQLVVRECQVLPQPEDNATTISTNPNHTITFSHPAYTGPSDILFTLPAFDHPNGGLDYETARVACGILANNRWNCYFTKERGGPEIKAQDINHMLPVGSYFVYFPTGDSTCTKFLYLPEFC